MKRFAAQYIFTNNGPPLKRAVITVNDDGTIVGVTDNAGDLIEAHSTEFHNGIIIPGMDLKILGKLKSLQSDFPEISLQDLIRSAEDCRVKTTGEKLQSAILESGKKPGLLLIQDLDLQNLRLLPESFITRLI
jgi:hypothetical protein